MTKTQQGLGEAKENLRRAEAERYRYRNYQRGTNGIGDERLEKDPAYMNLVARRDAARDAVVAADPKRPTPKARVKR